MRPLVLVHAALAVTVLSGCQAVGNRADVASVEEALGGVGVALPPRDPFAGIEYVPRSLADIEKTRDCGKPPKRNLSGWVEDKKKFYAYMKDKRDTFDGLKASEEAFQSGLPRRAAAFLTAIMPWDKEIARMEHNLFAATFYAAYGEFVKARSHLRVAKSNDRRHRYSSCRSRSRNWMKRAEAYLALAEGGNDDALQFTASARKALEDNRKTTDGRCLLLDQSWRDEELDVLAATANLRLGDLNKAESYARNAAPVVSPASFGYISPRSVFGRKALQILSRVKMRQGRYRDALSFGLMAKTAQMVSCVALTAPERAGGNRDIALSLAALDRFDSAYKIINEIESNLKTEPAIWNNMFASSVERGVILRETGHIEEAKAVFREAENKLSERFGAKHYFTAEARMLSALLDIGVSLDDITRSLRELLAMWQERSGQLTTDPAGQSVRLKWIVEDYLARAFKKGGNGKALGEAFEIAETLRTGMVQQALVQTALRGLAPDAETRALIRRQQDLQKKLGVLRQRLQDGSNYGQISSKTFEELERKIGETESAVAQLTDSVRSAVPDYDKVVGSHSFKLAQATTALEPDEAIVSLISGRKESFAWVITADGRVSGRRIAKTREDWSDDVGTIRAGLETTDGRLSSLADFDTKAANDLYRDLLQPMESHWSPASHLVFVTDNALASLPMGMLLRERVLSIPDDDPMFAGFKQLPWLIRTHAISMAPSVASFALLRQGGVSNKDRRAFLGIGDPVFNPREASAQKQAADAGQSRGVSTLASRAITKTRGLKSATLEDLPRLPDTADEIKAIAEVVGADHERDIIIGSRASEETIRRMNETGALGNYRILSFATHGLIPGDLDGLMSPALALSAPGGNPKGDWDDGLLTAEEIMELDLDADWAILSACNTASAQDFSTEAFSGLGRAFFYAGARSLLLSNWPVFSDSTRQMMVSLFKHETTKASRAQALRSAMLEIMDEGKFDNGKGLRFSYAHPLFWAPFSLVGDGGGA